MLMRQRQFEIKTVLLVFTLSKKRALKMEKTHPFTLENACRWCRKKMYLKTHAMLLGFLNKQLKQLQDEADCKEDNTL